MSVEWHRYWPQTISAYWYIWDHIGRKKCLYQAQTTLATPMLATGENGGAQNARPQNEAPEVTDQLAGDRKWRTIVSWKFGFWRFVSLCDATTNQGKPSKCIHSPWASVQSHCEQCGQRHQQHQDQKTKKETKPSEQNTHKVVLGKVWIQLELHDAWVPEGCQPHWRYISTTANTVT